MMNYPDYVTNAQTGLSNMYTGATPAMQPMIDASQPDELMIVSAIYDHGARKKSYSLPAEAFGLGKKAAA